MVGGELVLAVGHEGDLMRAHLAHKVHEVLGGIALDVVLGLGPVLAQQGSQLMHILRADVAAIGPRVHGDALGTGEQAELGRLCHAGNAQMPGVAQQGHLVDIDREGTAPGVVAGIGGDEGVHCAALSGVSD